MTPIGKHCNTIKVFINKVHQPATSRIRPYCILCIFISKILRNILNFRCLGHIIPREKRCSLLKNWFIWMYWNPEDFCLVQHNKLACVKSKLIVYIRLDTDFIPRMIWLENFQLPLAYRLWITITSNPK